MSQYIDQQSIYNYFPTSQSIPPRLIELLDWLNVVIHDEMGPFPKFTGQSPDCYFRDLNLSPYFGTFAQLGDGSLLAYWFYEGCVAEQLPLRGNRPQPPIVMLGSKGDLEVIADSIEDWVARLVDGKFPVSWAARMEPFYVYASGIWVEALGYWAEAVWNLTSATRSQLTALPPDAQHPNLQAWINRMSTNVAMPSAQSQ